MDQLEVNEETIRGRRGIKWHHFPSHVIPAWVAEMDFPVAQPIQRAMRQGVEGQDYGYPRGAGEKTGVEHAFADRMRRLYGWEADPELGMVVTNLVQAMTAALLAFAGKDEGVVIQTPIYPPFLLGTEWTKRRRVVNPLVDDGSRYVVDLEGLAAAIDEETRIFLLCNPHNPTGRVLERAELEGVARLAVERDLIIVSDEIHADLVLDGRHIPMASLGEEVAARTLTLASATKGFNIPGLYCGLMHFGSPELKERFLAEVPEWLLGHPNVFGVDATVAAWREGDEWLEQVLERLRRNRDLVGAWSASIPGLRYHSPEATYLAWLDCRELGLPGAAQEFFLEEAGVGLSQGQIFEPEGAEGAEGFVRLNFATTEPILTELLERMSSALGRRR